MDEEFEAVFEAHKDAVYQFAWRMTKSPAVAEDVTQDVFVALLDRKVRFDQSRGSLRALLLGITRHLVYKRWRHDCRWKSIDEETYVAPTGEDANVPLRDAIARAVASLPPLQREILILATYEEMPLQQISETLCIELSTVKGRLHRARQNLARILAPYKSSSVRNVSVWNR